MSVRVSTLGTALLGCIAVFALDQGCKTFFFEDGHSFSFLAGFVQSIHHQNYGIAFNIPVPQWLILGITLIAAGGVLFLLTRPRAQTSFVFSLLLGVLLGGALGNAFDRWQFGFVRDWLLLWNHSAINIADLGVLVGLSGAFILSQRSPQPKT